MNKRIYLLEELENRQHNRLLTDWVKAHCKGMTFDEAANMQADFELYWLDLEGLDITREDLQEIGEDQTSENVKLVFLYHHHKAFGI